MSNETTAKRKAVVTTPSERVILIEREFDAPRERVFAALLDPDMIPKWWGLDETKTIVEEMDVRPGGRWRFVERKDDGTEYGFRGVYREITPGERLVQTFEFEGMPGHVSLEEMVLEDLGDGRTKITATSTFHHNEERDGTISSGMERGLNQAYDKLEALLAELGGDA